MSVTVVSNYRDIGDLSTNLQKPDYDEVMHLLEPDNTSFSYLCRKFGVKKCENPTFSWFEDSYIPTFDAVNYSTGYSTSATGLVVDNATYFSVGDTVQVERTGEILRVTSTDASTYIGVVRSQGTATGTTAAAAIYDNDVLRILGNASSEGSAAPGISSTTENKRTNYAQLWRTAVGITTHADEAKLYTGKDWPYQLRKKAKEHAMKIENAFLWGEPGNTTVSYSATEGVGAGVYGTSDAMQIWFTGGIWWHMKYYASSDHLYNANGTLTKSAFIKNFLEPAMQKGSSKKVLFCGTKILAAISYWALGDMQTKVGDSTYGIAITKWQSPFGEISLVHHKQLNTPTSGSPTYGSWGFLIDFGGDNPPSYREYKKTEVKDVLLANNVLVEKKEYITQAGLQFPDPDQHAVLYGVTDYS